MSSTYICDGCGKKCFSSWDDADAVAEYERNFGRPFDPGAVTEVCGDCYARLMTGKTEVEAKMDKRMHLKAGIDPDGTPASKFINDLMIRLLQETPNPEDEPEPDEQRRGAIILGALVSVNAGVICNVLAEPEDRLTVMGVISQLSGEVFEEVARLQPQVEASRKPKQ